MMPLPFLGRLTLAALLAGTATACGQTGRLVLPEQSPPKQGYLLVDKPPPGTPAPPSEDKPAKVKAVSVPSPTAPFPPQPVEPRSPLSTQTP